MQPDGRRTVVTAAPAAAPELQLGRALKRWRPHKTPRLTLSLSLWLFGLYAALYASAPLPVTPAAEAAYAAHMRQAEQHLPARAAAAAALAQAEYDVASAKTWFWRFREEDKARVRAAQAVAASAAAAASAADARWAAHARSAKAALGIWSEAGVTEARREFWRAYEGGKVFAQRHTFWDVVFAVLSGRTEENAFTFVVNWVLRVVANFTVGMLSAVLSFIFGLPALVWGFAPSLLSGVLFFAVAALGGAAVVGTYLGALYGVAGGTVYLAARASVPRQRLAAAQRQQAYAAHLRGRAHAD